MSLDPTARRELADRTTDELIREEPLLLDVGGQQVLTMRTPGDDEALARGFLLSEGVIEADAQVRRVRFVPGDPAARSADTMLVDVDLPAEQLRGRLTRTHEIRSSCGVCGLASVEALLDELKPALPGVPKVSLRELREWRDRFVAGQRAFAKTGGCHGAALFAPDGSLLGEGEDVGRHNALDKAIGHAAAAGADLTRASAFLSGRAGFDLVLKCLRLRIPIVVSLSAASAASFDLCKGAGATLVGFLRAAGGKVYCDGGRLSG
jgi:FdhD protein